MPKLGDVLLKESMGTFFHGLISFGQAVFSHDPRGSGAELVHAALYADAGNVFESVGAGLSYGPATPGATWVGFRFNDAWTAELAVDIAHNYWHIQQAGTIRGYGSYTVSGAIGSLFGSSRLDAGAKKKAEELWTPQANKSFFCSNYVIRCFQAAGQTFDPPRFPIRADIATEPKELFGRLSIDPNWTNLGTVTF